MNPRNLSLRAFMTAVASAGLLACLCASQADAQSAARGVEIVSPLAVGQETLAAMPSAAAIEALNDMPLDTSLKLAPRDADGKNAQVDRWIPVRTCREYDRLLIEGWYAFDNFSMRQEVGVRQTCDIIRRLKVARPADVSYLPSDGMGNIGLYSASLVGAVTDDGGDVLRDYFRRDVKFADLPANGLSNIRKSGPYRIEYDTEGYWHVLTVFARGDFDADGVEDFLAAFTNGARDGGTYMSGNMLLLTRRAGENAIHPVAHSRN